MSVNSANSVKEVVATDGGNLLAMVGELANAASRRDAVEEEVRLRYIEVRLQQLLAKLGNTT